MRAELGIAQALDAVPGIEDHRARDHWPEESAAPDLIDATHQLRTHCPGESLVFRGALQTL